MPVAPSFSDLITQGIAESQARRPDLTLLDGDVSLAQLHGAGAMADAVVRTAVQLYKATFLDGAKGDDLTALVNDRLNLQRGLATAAQATVSFSRPAGPQPAGTIPLGTTIATEFDAAGDEVQFTTDANVVWALSEGGPKTVVATAVVAGRDGNVATNTIVRIIDQPPFDTTFTVDNTAAAGGGNDQETDDDLRTRSREFFATLRKGTLAALEFGAKEVPEVRVAAGTENIATGQTTLRVTDGDGNSTLQMVSDVITELNNWRCASANVLVVGGSKLILDMTITLSVRAGFDVVPLATVFSDAVTARLKKIKGGEKLFLDSAIGVLVAVAADDVLGVTFDTITGTPGGALPIADVVPTVGQVIRAGTITVVGA